MRRLTSDEKHRYEQDGYLVLKGLLDKNEVKTANLEADLVQRDPTLIHSDNLRARWQNHIETGESILDTIDPIVDVAPGISRIARNQELIGLLEELLEDRVCLFKDKLIYKPSGALGQAWHQDYISWPGFPRSFTTALIALDSASQVNGCLELFAGYHRQGYLSPCDGDYHDLPPSRFDPLRKISPALDPGDAVIFGCFVPHGSGPNRSTSFRRHLYLSYNKASDGGDQRDAHYRQFHSWLTKRYGEYGSMNHFFK